MTQRNDSADQLDPLGMWKTMRDSGMDAWSKMMLQFVNSEEYAKASGRMLDAYLTTSAPFRKLLETSMTQMLAQLNMPSRDDVTGVAERLTNLELRLDDLDAKLDSIQRELRGRPAGKATRSADTEEKR